MARLQRISQVETPASAPRYELRVRRHGPVETAYEIWQLPASASPHLTCALRVAGLRGRNLELVEHRVLKRLSQSGVKPGRPTDATNRGYALTEDLALVLGLLFRTLAPMRKPAARCGRWPRASRRWDVRRRPTGWEWRCIASTPAGY